MSQRERTLALLVGAAVLLWVGTVGLERYDVAKNRNEGVASATQTELTAAQAAALRGLHAQNSMRQWQEQSLPTNLDIAKSLYQDWLRQELNESGLNVGDIREQSPRVSRQNYRQATFVVSADGPLEKLVDFLYRFYQSNHLHRISAATLTPKDSRESLSISLTFDALSLPEAGRTDKLAEGSAETFSEPVEEIAKTLVSRNIFQAYKPPQPEQEVKAPEPEQVAEQPDEEAAGAFITGMTQGNGGWQMSIRLKDSGKMRYFRPGDEISIGRFTATIEELDGRRVIFSRSGDRYVLVLGQNLTQAQRMSTDEDS